MTANCAVRGAPAGLEHLARRLEAVEGFADVVSELKQGARGAAFDGVWGSSCALAASALAGHAPGPLVVICPHQADIDEVAADLELFSSLEIHRFGAWDALPTDRNVGDEVYGERLRLLKRLARNEPCPLIVTSIQSLLQPVVDRQSLTEHTRLLARGTELSRDELARWLAEHGFEPTTGVQLPGEFSVRGGIIDLFAIDWDQPVRVEFFGDEVESIRQIEVSTQRSLSALDAIELTVLKPGTAEREFFSAYLPTNSWIVLLEPAELDEEGRHYLERLGLPAHLHTVASVFERFGPFPVVTFEAISGGSLGLTCHLQIESVERFSGEISRVRDELESIGEGQEVYLACQTEAEVQRLDELFGGTRLAGDNRLHFLVGRLGAGFRLVPAKTTVLSTRELFNRGSEAVRPSRRRWGRVIDSFLELREGDYVVHVGHGIAKYLGLRLLEKGEHAEEHLELEFQGGTKLYVPTSKIGLVQKYVGGTKARPTLARLGGRSWIRQKEMAEQAVLDLAAEMLELQAMRAARPGITFPTDTEWQKEFDASFPYDETPDQYAAIADTKRDMEAARPMDRLICGDVGYGKTEVSMRAAFKAVDSGYQVAVLVPTTVLAEQHRRTFTDRMAEYPFHIASLSRFLTRKEQADVIAGLESGQVDIVIGTHRLVQPDIHFHNIGLVIIDEEQRFGVEVKERLKALRQIVDVLTMTATPIPRTLHMSLLGLRDISNLETPPADRLAVETRVTRFSHDLVRQATLRELNRGGQVYFVHNRVHDIEVVATRLRETVPEATVRIAHGQMPEGALEQVMLDFVAHKFDILLATTIVESGLDIRNVNTIFIDQADTYGLADLHQLRGRVGRYIHRAYCYLLVDPHKSLSSTAAKRLRAIEEFSNIGAGFAIAMRDLEIRGAGNILGTQQSGHIAAVGYELYCQLLEQAVYRLKKVSEPERIDVHIDLPGHAFLPRGYVSDLRQKIDLYRRLNRLTTDAELAELMAELVDRFGPWPQPVEWLLRLAQLRIWAHGWGITAVYAEPGYVVFDYSSRPKIEHLAERSAGALRIVDDKSAYLPVGQELANPAALEDRLKSVLRPD